VALELSLESLRLLNPAFAGGLLLRASHGFQREAKSGLPYIFSYLVLPLVLHPETRERLPNAVVTRLPTWTERNGDLIPFIAKRAGDLASATREALLLVTTTGLASLDELGRIEPLLADRVLQNFEKTSVSTEVGSCFNKANFVGRWFATSGTVATVMTVLGVKL
jgi:ABC-3C biological conflict system middle component